METSSPIFVTGMPRSGTTLMQHLLSQHPRIRIHGQEPSALCWGEWLTTAVNGVGFASRSNQEFAYDEPHYAAPSDTDETARRLLDYIRWYLTGGDDTPRWGAKSLTQCRIAPQIITQTWPETRWIVCIRDPFRSIESLRNTFDAKRQIDLAVLAEWWLDAVQFAHSQPAALPVFPDRLTDPVDRQQFVGRLFEFIGEDVTTSITDFVAEWPVVHKVTQDSDRRYQLSRDERSALLEENRELSRWASRLGFLQQEVPVP